MIDNNTLLAFKLKALNNQIRRILDRSAITDNSANLTGVQYGILGYITEVRKGDDVYQKDIEAEFNIRRSTASEMLRQLEDKGFISRESVQGDARLKKIVPMDKAREMSFIANQHMLMVEEKMSRNISKEELEQFYSTLDKIQRNLSE